MLDGFYLSQHRPQHLPETSRRSALMLVVVTRVDAEPRLLLTRRQSGLRQYSNDWCLPGGRCEVQDASLLDCAWRELAEETGIFKELCVPRGGLDDFYNGKGELVRPFICTLTEEAFRNNVLLQRDEVAEYALLPLSRLEDIEVDTAQRFPSARQPAYLVPIGDCTKPDDYAWGLTASILVHFRDVLTGRVSPLCKGQQFKQKESMHEQ